MMGKHVGFIVEVLQDHGIWSTETMTKCYVTTPDYGYETIVDPKKNSFRGSKLV